GTWRGHHVQVTHGHVAGEALLPVAAAGVGDVLRPFGVVDGDDDLARPAQGACPGQVGGAVVEVAGQVGGPVEQLLHADAVDGRQVAGVAPQFGRDLREDPEEIGRAHV